MESKAKELKEQIMPTFMSGLDITCFMSNEDSFLADYKTIEQGAQWDNKYIRLKGLASISVVSQTYHSSVLLTLTVWPQSCLHALKKHKHLYLLSNNEYGCRSVMELKDIYFEEYSCDISSDDLVVEEKILFNVKNVIPWLPL